jgi:hypothetical protein
VTPTAVTTTPPLLKEAVTPPATLAAVEPTAEVAPPVAPTAEAPPTDVPTVEPIFEPTRTVSPEEIEDDIDFAGEATPTREPTRTVSPDALAPSIGWGGVGGGVLCNLGATSPEIIPFAVTESLELQRQETNQLPLGGMLELQGCGFPPSEVATYAYILPDGQAVTGQLSIDESGFWTSSWWSVPGEPLGEYGFELTSSIGVHPITFTVYAPSIPLIMSQCRTGEWAMTVLTGFAPGEEVLLGRYVLAAGMGGGPLTDYEYVTIGPDGTAVIYPPPEESLIVAIGQNAQMVTRPSMDWTSEVTLVASAISEMYCNN